MKSLSLPKSRMITLPADEVQRLFKMGSDLAALAEDILEAQGIYRPQFVKGLERSLADAEAGRIQAIDSLADLV